MTVRELIAALLALDLDAEVIIYESPSSQGYETEVHNASTRADGKVEITS